MSETENKSAFNALSDDELVSHIRQGSSDAFNALVLRYSNTVSYLASRYYSDSLTNEDWFQEGMIGFLCAVRSYRLGDTASFSTYASVCIRNRLSGCLKRVTNSKNLPMSSSLPYDDLFIDSVHSPEEDYIENERYRFFSESFINQLSAAERQVIKCYLAGFSYAEIADKLGITVKSVDNAICRVKHKLKMAFKT